MYCTKVTWVKVRFKFRLVPTKLLQLYVNNVGNRTVNKVLDLICVNSVLIFKNLLCLLF